MLLMVHSIISTFLERERFRATNSVPFFRFPRCFFLLSEYVHER